MFDAPGHGDYHTYLWGCMQDALDVVMTTPPETKPISTDQCHRGFLPAPDSSSALAVPERDAPDETPIYTARSVRLAVDSMGRVEKQEL